MSEPSASDSQMDEVVPHSNGAADTESSSEAEDLSTVKQHQPAADAQPSDRLPDSPDAAVHQQNGGNRDAPLTPEALHENGNGVSADVEEGSAEGSSPAEPAAEAPWTKRLYFVRMPKPQEDNQYAVKVLQEEIDVYKNQVQLLNESLNVVKMQRDNTKNNVQEARDNFNAANEAFQAKQQEVQPLQQGRKTQNDAQRSFQQEYRDLEVRSEGELDAKIKAMEYHMSHESMPIAEERQMVKHIKKLRDQRPRVRQYEAQFADVEEARVAASSNRGELKELQQERQVLFEDKQLQQTILNKHRDEMRSLDEKMNEIKEERSRVKEQQDNAYHRMRSLQQQSRGKKDAYYQNRRFSQEVRKLLKEGKLEQARDMCEEQTTAALGHLHENAEWRQEYLDLWSHQRPPPFRIGFDDYDFDSVPNDSGREQKGGAAKGKTAAPVLTGKEKAQAIIAAALAEVRQDLTRKANNAGSASARVPGMTPSLPAPSEAPAEPAAVEKAAVKPPKPSKASKAPKPVEVPPEVFQREEQPFEPPPVVQKPVEDKQADAEQVRQQQARLQEENQRRKEKAAERKKKNAQKRKAQAAEHKAQEAAAKAETAAQQQKPQAAVESDVDAEDASLLPSSDSVAAASSSIANSAVAAADKATAAVKSAPPQVNSAANKAVNKAAKQAEALKRKLGTPKARSVRKRGWKADANQLVKSAKQWGLAHPAELGLAGVVVAMVCMVYALLSRQSSQVSVS